MIISNQSPSNFWLVDCFPDTFLQHQQIFNGIKIWSNSGPVQQTNVFLHKIILNNLIFATGSPIMHENVALINKYTHF